MNIFARPGDKVIFLCLGGYQYDKEHAKKVLELGKVYTVKFVNIEKWMSHVTLEEIAGEFNSCLFEDAADTEEGLELQRSKKGMPIMVLEDLKPFQR